MESLGNGWERRPPGKPILFVSVVVSVVVLDLLTKQFAQRALPPGEQVPVVGDYFSLLFIENPGVAFGISLGPYGQWLMIGLSLVALIALGAMYRQTAAADRRRLLAMALIWGGAIGNLADRLRSTRGVVDFLVFQYRDWQSPVFNIADVAVTAGAVLLAYCLWHEDVPATVPERERRRGTGPTSPTVS